MEEKHSRSRSCSQSKSRSRSSSCSRFSSRSHFCSRCLSSDSKRSNDNYHVEDPNMDIDEGENSPS
eukprot:13973709-Ditylum_brightwellii.AAC.1